MRDRCAAPCVFVRPASAHTEMRKCSGARLNERPTITQHKPSNAKQRNATVSGGRSELTHIAAPIITRSPVCSLERIPRRNARDGWNGWHSHRTLQRSHSGMTANSAVRCHFAVVVVFPLCMAFAFPLLRICSHPLPPSPFSRRCRRDGIASRRHSPSVWTTVTAADGTPTRARGQTQR